MIDVSLVAGFLGAGKTTWLAHQLTHDRPAVSLVVVNDFADEGVDHLLLEHSARAAGARIAAIVGGCLCCDRLPELRALLITAINDHHDPSSPSEPGAGIVLETSGLAEPDRLVRLIADDPVLRTNLTLRTLVVAVDGLGGRRLLRHRPSVRAQVAIADKIVLTRADLAGPEELGELAATVRRLNTTAMLVGSSLGHESAVVPVEPDPADVFDDAAPGTAGARSWSVELNEGTSWAEYALWLDALCRSHPAGVMRTKGVVPTRDGPLLVQSMGADIAAPVPAGAGAGRSMVFIVDGIDPRALEQSLRRFVPSAFRDEAPTAGPLPG